MIKIIYLICFGIYLSLVFLTWLGLKLLIISEDLNADLWLPDKDLRNAIFGASFIPFFNLGVVIVFLPYSLYKFSFYILEEKFNIDIFEKLKLK